MLTSCHATCSRSLSAARRSAQRGSSVRNYSAALTALRCAALRQCHPCAAVPRHTRLRTVPHCGLQVHSALQSIDYVASRSVGRPFEQQRRTDSVWRYSGTAVSRSAECSGTACACLHCPLNRVALAAVKEPAFQPRHPCSLQDHSPDSAN